MTNDPVVQWLERRSYKAVTIVRLYPGVLNLLEDVSVKTPRSGLVGF